MFFDFVDFVKVVFIQIGVLFSFPFYPIIVHRDIFFFKIDFVIFTLNTFTKTRTANSFFEALAVILNTASLRTITSPGMNFSFFSVQVFKFGFKCQRIFLQSFVFNHINEIFMFIGIVTPCTIAGIPTNLSIGKTITVKF